MHRDSKGTNVFLTEYNAIETAKVLDFGVAKVWNGAVVAQMADDSEVTRQGVAVGTPAYLAPEILRGSAASPATDQYALGILLYSALTGGRKPFELQKKGELRELHLMRAIMKGDHPPARTYRKDLPEGLEAVIERAIERDADRRYSSVHALGEALLAWASPRGRLQWTGHFTKAPPEAVAAHSMAVPSETVLQARGGTAVDADRSPAVAATALAPRASAVITRAVESREIRGLLGLEAAPRRRRPSFFVAWALVWAAAIAAGLYVSGTLRLLRRPSISATPVPPGRLGASRDPGPDGNSAVAAIGSDCRAPDTAAEPR